MQDFNEFKKDRTEDEPAADTMEHAPQLSLQDDTAPFASVAANDADTIGETVFMPTAEEAIGETVFMPTTEEAIGETVFMPTAEGGADETQFLGEANAAAQTQEKQGVEQGTMIDDYMIIGLISDHGKESTVYLARKSGQQYALKLYQRAAEVSPSQLELLKNLDCPYVASLQDYGTYQRKPYEVYAFYKKGTIESIGKVETRKLTEYVNQLNEGLHALHTLGGWNMIHGDIKPANIFLSDDGERLLIGDFGISAAMNGENYSLDLACGTPEFAPPTIGVVNRTKRTPAFDYGSLGLVVYYLATGRSYFSGMSSSAIAESWMKGIQIPAELDTRIKMLLEGLLVSDEKLRYSYLDVRNWYKGSFVQVKKDESVFTKKQPQGNVRLWFGIFDGQSIEVSSIPELVQQMKQHWQQAGMKLTDTNFYNFLDKASGSPALSEKVRKIVAENDLDAAVFKTIYLLSKDSDIVYREKNYGDASAFVQKIIESDDADVKEILLTGLFRYYLEQLGYPDDMKRMLDEILGLRDVSDAFKMRVFSYVFSAQKEYNGCGGVDALRTMVAASDLETVEKITEDEAFFAWLYSQGMGDLAIAMLRAKEDEA